MQISSWRVSSRSQTRFSSSENHVCLRAYGGDVRVLCCYDDPVPKRVLHRSLGASKYVLWAVLQRMCVCVCVWNLKRGVMQSDKGFRRRDLSCCVTPLLRICIPAYAFAAHSLLMPSLKPKHHQISFAANRPPVHQQDKGGYKFCSLIFFFNYLELPVLVCARP